MKELLLRYFFTLLHPFEVHRNLRLQRASAGGVLHFDGEGASRYRGVDYYEAIAVSWVLVLCHSFYSPVALHLGIHSRQMWELPAGIFPSEEWEYGMLLIKLVAGVTFFPLFAWVQVSFWDMIIRFFAALFNREDGNTEQVSQEIARHSLVGHVFLIIPIFGGLAHLIAGLVLLYAGLRKNLSLSRAQSFVVIASPVIILLGLFFLFLLSLLSVFY